ncbi:hemin receptor [Nostoc sp. 3335mG]|nr:hemin receptor [Nostoc sp. 3335mG]
MTTRQIDLIQDSFAAVVPITDRAATVFYGRLFALAPETRALFHGDMEEQGRKLFLTLATIVDALDRLDTIVPTARELAIRHVAYGAQPQHYRDVGTALLETLRSELGSGFDAQTEAAWGAAYTILSGVMLDAAAAKA